MGRLKSEHIIKFKSMKLNFGKAHKGKDIDEVPDSYLLWMIENVDYSKLDSDLIQYLKDNEMSIRKNAEKEHNDKYADMDWGDWYT